VGLLLEGGAIPDPAFAAESPLSLAVLNATDPQVIKLLLDFGANPNACGVEGQTALVRAAQKDKVEFASLLLERADRVDSRLMATAVICNSHRVADLLRPRYCVPDRALSPIYRVP